MAEKNNYRGKRKTSSLNLEFGVPEAAPEVAIPDPVLPTATIPEGEDYTAAANVDTRKLKAKVYSGGRMVVDKSSPEAQKAKDIEDKVKDIVSNPELDHSKKPSIFDDIAKQLRDGDNDVIALNANDAHDHIEDVHNRLNKFVSDLPSAILAKADLHEQTANTIKKIKPDHPEVQNQLNLASRLRDVVGISSTAGGVRNLRAAKEALANGGGTLDKNLPFQLNVVNKLVSAATKFRLLKRGGPTFVDDSPAVNHPALIAAHSTISSVNGALNTFLKPLKMRSPVSTSELEIHSKAIKKMQTPNKSVKPATFQDEHPETGEMSKPGHIWGEKPALNIDGVSAFTGGKDLREREQIPLTDAGEAYIKKTYGKTHPVMSRFKSAKASLNKSTRKRKDLQENAQVPGVGAIDLADDGRNDELKDKLSMGQYSEPAQATAGVNPPAKFPDASPAGTIARQVRGQAIEGAGLARQTARDVEHHTMVAFESLISGSKLPLATSNYIESHPDKDAIKEKVETLAAAHTHAVQRFSVGEKPSQEARKILGAKGLDRARKIAVGE